MSSIVKFNRILLGTGIALAFTLSGVYANTLSEIEVNAQNSGYGIVLRAEDSIQYKKIVDSDDKIILELKDVKASDSLNTIYNNVSNIENVTIQPSSKNDLKITLKGSNIVNSKVFFETEKNIAAPLMGGDRETIKLNEPISNYTPVYNRNLDTEEENIEESSSLAGLVSQIKSAKKMINTDSKSSNNMNFLTILGMIIVAASFALKGKKAMPAKPNMQKNAEPAIGLSGAMLDRELNINRSMAASLNNKLPQNSANLGYGMKAYQQSQKNPYMSNNSISNGISNMPKIKTAPRGEVQRPRYNNINSTKSLQNRVANPIRPNNIAQPAMKTTPLDSNSSNMDSMKFLESITKIYEKNGRADLAKGLKDNLRKAQYTKQTVM